MEGAKTIKVENGELYVQDDTIVGRMETKDNITRYYRGDKLHRDGDLPACIERNGAGMVTYEEYWRDGKRHRDGDLPAYIKRNGVLCFEEYYRNGEYHRDGDLPARIMRNEAQCFAQQSINGVVTFEEYYRDGVQITPADIKMAKLAQELAAANETIEKLRARMQKILALVE